MNYKVKTDLPHNSDDFVYDILKARGIDDPTAYMEDKGFTPTNWMELSQIDEAMPILEDVMTGDYTIGLIADCDVDGFCSAAITYMYIKDWNPNVNIKTYIHSGKAHGIDDEIYASLKRNPVDILIIPDASSSEPDLHQEIAEDGTRILVIDHHLSDIPNDPWAVRVNNQLSGETVNKTLCGAAMVFFVMHGYDRMHNTNYADKYIDLCSIALIADMMDLRNPETHHLVKWGLDNITNPCICDFITDNSFSLGGRTNLFPMDIAFYIAPLINSVIRVGTMAQKTCLFEALINGDAVVQSTKRGAKPGDTEIAGEQAARIAKNCKALQGRLVDRAMEILEKKIQDMNLLENKILLVPVNDDDDIPSTITGLVAMKLTAKYHHPTMVLRECDDGVLKGSTRAEADTAIGSFKDYMIGTGLVEYAEGHALANGAGIQETNVDEFIRYTNENLKNVDFNEKFLNVDYIFNCDTDNIEDFILDIDYGKPYWGQNVEEPTFIVENIPINKADVKIMKNNCLKFTYNSVTYVIFKNEQAIEDFQKYDKMRVTVYGKGSINEWLGRKNAQVIMNQYDIKNARYVF